MKFSSNIRKRKTIQSYENVKDSSLFNNSDFQQILKYFRFHKRLQRFIFKKSRFAKMEWDNLDEIMPNEITKFDQNQISKWSNQLAAASYYFSSKTNSPLKRNAEMLKGIIG